MGPVRSQLIARRRWRRPLGAVLLLAASGALAGLRDSPPKGLHLAGTWQIDEVRSDDPRAVLDKAREEMPARREGRGGFGGRGGMGGGMGGMGRGGMGGEGDWGRHRRSQGEDRPQGDDTGRAQKDGEHSGRGELEALATNPATLAFSGPDRRLKIAAGEDETECEAGDKVALQDRFGDAERQCGWDGRAWVIETQRTRGAKRTDRYELSKDGRTLLWSTEVSGGRMPKLQIKRVYTPLL